MTEAQAHEFIARWSRRLIAWRARNEAEQLRDLSLSCVGMMAGGLLVAASSSVCVSYAPFWWKVILIGGLSQFGFSLCMVLRLRQAARALHQRTILNHKS